MFKRIVCTLLGVLCVASCTTSNLSVSEEHNRISVQLYSVRDDVANNFQGTLVELSELGIDGVEFAGDYGEYENNPEGLKGFLTQIGLKVSGAHVSFNMLKGDRFSETVNFHKKLGTPYLIVPWDERAFSPKHIDELVNDLNQISLKLAGTGIKVGYHNHAQEIAEFSNSTFWDYIAQNTNSDVILQLDVDWVVHADQEPTDFIDDYPGRIKTSHFKSEVKRKNDSSLIPLIGKDGVEWKEIVATGNAKQQLDWIVVEQEAYPNGMSPMESLSTSVKAIQSILKSKI